VGIIVWIVLGAIAGFTATRVLGMMDGVWRTILMGMAGAVLGGLVAGALLNREQIAAITLASIVVSVIGAIVVVYVANMIEVRRRPTV
jgi:uncharacterized membrane protein YeaQ/YmgE (transglycosylase-associated protein family)